MRGWTGQRLCAAACLMALTLLGSGPSLARELAGVTNMIQGSSHGTQVEYVAPDGNAYLWYRGNTNILKGSWKVEDANMCFNYGPNSYNPVTKQHGGWECEPVDIYQGSITQQVSGDPMGLAGRRAVPYDLTGRSVSLDQILASVLNPGAPPSGSQLSCESILTNAERSKRDMSLAASTYFHGMFMGKRCVDVDYARAFDLAKRAGDGVDDFVRVLRERAASGNTRAEAALHRLGYELTTQ